MTRRTLAAALLGLSVLGGAALTAAPAHAAGTCVLTPPDRVVINAPRVELTATVTGDCTAPDNGAFWYSKRSSDSKGGYAFYHSSDPPAGVYFQDQSVEYGVSQWFGFGACPEDEDGACETYTQSATGPSDIRAATVAGISGSRSRTTISLAGSSYVYSYVSHRQVRRSAAAVWQVQERTGATWRSFKNVTTPTTGLTTLKVYNQPAGRKYRFVLAATPSSWTGVSATVTP